MVRVAKIASLLIALFSFTVAPLLQFAPEGLWQVMRIFTGFYNIPIIAIVMIGLFARHVPASGPKIVIVFHIIAYAMFQFVLDDYIGIHFIHLYAILFFTEIGIMLLVGYFSPRLETWTFHRKEVVDLTPWRYAVPCAATLLSCVIVVYLLFSPLGLVNGTSVFFLPLVALLLFLNILVWYLYSKAIHSS
jgi:SSS family solute:Na+ symporter